MLNTRSHGKVNGSASNGSHAANGPSITFSSHVEHPHKNKRVRGHIESDLHSEDIDEMVIETSFHGDGTNGVQTEDPNVDQFIEGVFSQEYNETLNDNSDEQAPTGSISISSNDRARQKDKKQRRTKKVPSPSRVALAPVPLHSTRVPFKKVRKANVPQKVSYDNTNPDSPSDDKRGPYNCGKCGKPKKGHDCSVIETFLYMQIPSNSVQSENSPLPARNSLPYTQLKAPQLKFTSQYYTRSSETSTPIQPVSPNPKTINAELSLRKSPRRNNS